MKVEKNSKVSRRDFLRVLAATAGGVALASCGTTPASQGQEVSGGPASSQGEVTIRLWTMNDPAWIQATEDMIQKYGAVRPDVKFKYENFPYDEFISTIQTGMAAKNEADIIEMFGTWVHSYAKGGTISVVPDDVLNMSQAAQIFYKAPLDGYALDGKLYGFPHEYNLENGGVLVNKTMFDAESLSYPPDWASWGELISDAKPLTKMDGNTMTVSGFDFINSDGLAFWLWEGILERGADYFAADKIHLNLLSPEAEDTVQWMVDMVQKDKVVDANTFNFNIADVQDAFFQGLVAIGFRGPWVVPVGRINYPDFQDPWNYVSIPPLFGNTYNFAADSGWGYVVSPNSKVQKEAWDFSKFVCVQGENARVWNKFTGSVPALQALGEDPSLLDDEDWLAPSLKVLPYGRFVGDLQDRDFIWYDVVGNTILLALQGQMSVKDAMTKMDQDSNAKIDSVLKGT